MSSDQKQPDVTKGKRWHRFDVDDVYWLTGAQKNNLKNTRSSLDFRRKFDRYEMEYNNRRKSEYKQETEGKL